MRVLLLWLEVLFLAEVEELDESRRERSVWSKTEWFGFGLLFLGNGAFFDFIFFSFEERVSLLMMSKR